MDIADAHWPRLEQTVTRALRDMNLVVARQPITRTWTAVEAAQARRLIQALHVDWDARRIRHETFTQLDHLSGRMSVAGCTVMRANLEALREQVRLILHDTATALSVTPAP
ncbi:hypothetical protein [Deinococcus sedimenti]|uniref:Uncharacterized protein n=1 Tax=Deinococcus sedimenti TaxID=1867090 RepID=A0ABQ2RYQ4_9DEIO|nr:hypothetical protein [Deinococcus sedimenti]GGR81478.1 hypothetical protein GCM10008960_05520 [Deinococcus sedimenti]